LFFSNLVVRLHSKTEIVFYNDLWLFRPERGFWENINAESIGSTTIPCKRYGHSLTLVNESVYMFGGFVTEGLTSLRLCDLWELNPGTSWVSFFSEFSAFAHVDGMQRRLCGARSRHRAALRRPS
jgi:hypothetical protein